MAPRDYISTQARYGSAWQEFRAWVASHLVGLALSVHFRCTMDMASDLAEMRKRKAR